MTKMPLENMKMDAVKPFDADLSTSDSDLNSFQLSDVSPVRHHVIVSFSMVYAALMDPAIARRGRLRILQPGVQRQWQQRREFFMMQVQLITQDTINQL
jgi:hypothetical protein